jgi:hypothetical protein
VRDGWIRIAIDRAGTIDQRLRLVPSPHDGEFALTLPACPSMMLETAGLADGRAFRIMSGGREDILIGGQRLPVHHDDRGLVIRLMDERESRDALSPPEPSEWDWQHQGLVVPSGGALVYQLASVARADGGSGVEAALPLPADASEVSVSGEDLVSQAILRGGNRSLKLVMRWKTRGILDRRVSFSYRMPLRPLDRKWTLETPGGPETKTRFVQDRPARPGRLSGGVQRLVFHARPYRHHSVCSCRAHARADDVPHGADRLDQALRTPTAADPHC